MKILLDFSTKLGREDIFKPTIGNKSLHEISNDNGVRLVNFATSKNFRAKSTMFPHRNIHKYTWTSWTAADCDSDHHLVVAKIRERLAVNKQRSQRFHMERFNLKKLNEVDSKEQFLVEVSNRFAALGDLDAEVNSNSAWETVRETKNLSQRESRLF
jgi:hypothetical protein